MPYLKGNLNDAVHAFKGLRPIERIYKGPVLIWQAGNAPVIPVFTAAPASIDLDNRPSGTISFSVQVAGTAGEDTAAQIVRLPNGENVGTSFLGVNGAGINQTLPNIAQPTQDTTYRLIARNNEGSSHKDFTVRVTQDPLIDSFVVLHYVSGGPAHGQTAYMRAIFKGSPQPSLSADQGIGALNPRHFRDAGETNTWMVEFSHFFGRMTPPQQRVVTLTATNSSGSNTRQLTTDAI